ncbi:MAG: AAA family ATPase [Candidatus Jidaibacter sp.]|nr:AAA family ATPase [Candidatus Jidaibacter sp.]
MTIGFLREIYHGLLDAVVIDKHRYLFDQVDLSRRLTGIVGARGVGKTTLMLQLIKQKLPHDSKAFYVSADNIYFQDKKLFEFVTNLYRYENIDYFFIDEIHRYQNWDQELKNIYDSFPNIKVVFSGSSSIDLVKGSYDLSRRATLHTLYGLSFREYLNFYQGLTQPKVFFDDLINNPEQIANSLLKLPMLLGHFQKYLAYGYYPYYQEDTQGFYEKIHQSIDKAVHQDIANFYQLKTQNLVHFKRILNFLATIPPGEFSINSLAKNLQIDNKTANFYVGILVEIMLVRAVTAQAGGNKLLRLPAKVFIDNTTLLTALNSYLGENLDVGTIRELFFLQSVAGANLLPFYSTTGDYAIKGHYFEIGGKHKSHHQLKREQNAFVVRDGILHPSHKTLPLYLFGFLY